MARICGEQNLHNKYIEMLLLYIFHASPAMAGQRKKHWLRGNKSVYMQSRASLHESCSAYSSMGFYGNSEVQPEQEYSI